MCPAGETGRSNEKISHTIFLLETFNMSYRSMYSQLGFKHPGSHDLPGKGRIKEKHKYQIKISEITEGLRIGSLEKKNWTEMNQALLKVSCLE